MALLKDKKIKKEVEKNDKVKSGGKHHSTTEMFLIKQAWITEKAGLLSTINKYIFITEKKANKSEIKKAIESLYNVKVADVNIINIKGKTKRLGRSLGRTSAHKKAIVTLKPGNKIDIMPA